MQVLGAIISTERFIPKGMKKPYLPPHPLFPYFQLNKGIRGNRYPKHNAIKGTFKNKGLGLCSINFLNNYVRFYVSLIKNIIFAAEF